MDEHRFTTTIEQAEDMDATAIPVPPEVIAALGSGKRPKVVVTLNGYRYRSTVAVYRERFMLPLNREHRRAAGVEGGEEVVVTLALDTEPRTVALPDDIAAALDDAGLRARFEALAYTHRKEHVGAIEEAKAPATRERRIAKLLAALGEPASDLPRAAGKPARNALAAAGYHTLEQVATLSERELLAMHGVGPRAVTALRAALAERGLDLAP